MIQRILAVGAGLLGLAVVYVATSAVWTEPFTGNPATPIAFTSANWDITYSAVGHGEIGEPSDVSGAQAQHGPDCASPLADGSVRHVAPTLADHVFQCRDHVMTYPVNATSAMRLVPNQLLDLSGGEGRVQFDVSTLTLSSRDWLSIFVQDWNSQEQKITDADIPSAQGNPRNAIHIEQGVCGSFTSQAGTWVIERYDADRTQLCVAPQHAIDEALTRSAVTRTTVEIVINRNGNVRVSLPQHSLVLTEGNVGAIPWDLGIVTLVHNAYNPEKGVNPFSGNPVGEPNTWHWDNVTIDPAIPFTIVKTDHRGSNTAAVDTWQFASPLPANSLVRFEAFSDPSAGAVRVRFDDGPWLNPAKMSAHTKPENAASYTITGQQGATRITIEVVAGGFGFVRDINNVSAFALVGGTPSPTPSSSPTSSPTSTVNPTPTPTATATPAPTATPTATAPPAPDTCDITLRRNGLVEWTSAVTCP